MEKHRLEVTVAIENMAAVMAFIEEHTALIGNPKLAYNLAMVVEELSLNVFNYAYDGRQGNFSLSIINDTEQRKVIMEFCDDGKPYNPLLLGEPDVNTHISKRQIGGLGIMMAKKLTDQQHYVRENGQNILTVVKNY